MFKREEDQRREFTEKHGFIRPPMSIEAFGKRLAVVGGTIYSQERQGQSSFLHLIHDHALMLFGDALLDAEEAKPLERRHPALQWMYAYVDHVNKLNAEGNTAPAMRQIGAGAAWTRFSYDLFTIKDNATLESVLKKRLLNPATFQAARHELWVAALCLAAGFELQFENEADNSSTHPEFIGTDKFSKARIAVEAKSRHRKGVLGFAGGKDVDPGESVGIRDMVLAAFKKSADVPLYVFIDVNLPPSPDEEIWGKWIEEIELTMKHLQDEGYASPCPANTIFFSNDPSHYLPDRQIGLAGDRLWLKHFHSAEPRIAHPSPDVLERLRTAHTQRRTPPADYPDFK